MSLAKMCWSQMGGEKVSKQQVSELDSLHWKISLDPMTSFFANLEASSSSLVNTKECVCLIEVRLISSFSPRVG